MSPAAELPEWQCADCGGTDCQHCEAEWLHANDPADHRPDETERSDGSSPATDAPNPLPSGPETRG